MDFHQIRYVHWYCRSCFGLLIGTFSQFLPTTSKWRSITASRYYWQGRLVCDFQFALLSSEKKVSCKRTEFGPHCKRKGNHILGEQIIFFYSSSLSEGGKINPTELPPLKVYPFLKHVLYIRVCYDLKGYRSVMIFILSVMGGYR